MRNIDRIKKYVQNEMESLCVAHDFIHIQRVVHNAIKIAKIEGNNNIDIIEAGALLHETFDDKFFTSNQIQVKKKQIEKLLEESNFTNEEIQKIIFIAENVGFGKSLERTDVFQGFTEFYIVEDADRLEAIGAIAIGRAFAYGGKKGRALYDPDVKIEKLTDKKSYHDKASTETTINHFYEKLFLLKDLMHTKTGKKLAEPRHAFMKDFVDRFLDEWNHKI